MGRNTESCKHFHLAGKKTLLEVVAERRIPPRFKWEMKLECSVGMGINHRGENTKGSAGFSPSLDVLDEKKLFFCMRWRDMYWSNISNWPRFRHN